MASTLFSKSKLQQGTFAVLETEKRTHTSNLSAHQFQHRYEQELVSVDYGLVEPKYSQRREKIFLALPE